jgi:hypothetical protein
MLYLHQIEFFKLMEVVDHGNGKSKKIPGIQNYN